MPFIFIVGSIFAYYEGYFTPDYEIIKTIIVVTSSLTGFTGVILGLVVGTLRGEAQRIELRIERLEEKLEDVDKEESTKTQTRAIIEKRIKSLERIKKELLAWKKRGTNYKKIRKFIIMESTTIVLFLMVTISYSLVIYGIMGFYQENPLAFIGLVAVQLSLLSYALWRLLIVLWASLVELRIK